MHDIAPATKEPAGTAAAARVELRGVEKVFPSGVAAVAGIDLDVAPGEFVAVLGPSGCGKSTLLRMIAGLDRPTRGEARVRYGDRPHHITDAPPRSPGVAGGTSPVAYVFQDAHLLPWRTVLRNVTLPLELAGAPKARQTGAAMAALRQVGLADAVDRYPAQLSGGMRMRVSLARALVTEPQLLLLDEPFAALDEITRQQLDDQLRALWGGRGMTVVFVTHSITEAAYLADRAVVLSPRPARVVVDHALDLPRRRDAALRGEARFAAQTRVLYEALERGEVA